MSIWGGLFHASFHFRFFKNWSPFFPSIIAHSDDAFSNASHWCILPFCDIGGLIVAGNLSNLHVSLLLTYPYLKLCMPHHSF